MITSAGPDAELLPDQTGCGAAACKLSAAVPASRTAPKNERIFIIKNPGASVRWRRQIQGKFSSFRATSVKTGASISAPPVRLLPAVLPIKTGSRNAIAGVMSCMAQSCLEIWTADFPGPLQPAAAAKPPLAFAMLTFKHANCGVHLVGEPDRRSLDDYSRALRVPGPGRLPYRWRTPGILTCPCP